MRLPRQEKEPAYLRIWWEVPSEDGDGMVSLEANLCHPCRREMADKHPNARGCGEQGHSCDLCEGRQPRRAQARPRT